MENETKTTADVPIVLSQDLKTKIDYLSTTFEPEVAGWLTGEVKKDYIYLDDLLIPKQEVTGGSVDINQGSSVDLMKEFKDRCKRIIGHMHTHGSKGSPFWSSIDEDNIKQIIEPRKFFIFIVSAGGKNLVRLESRKPFRISIDNMPYSVLRPNFDEIKKQIDAELKAKVTEKSYNNFNKDSNYVHSSAPSIYDYSKRDEKAQEDYEMNLGGDFELEIADHVLADFSNKKLTIRGLDEYTATQIANMYPNFKPESYGEFYNKIVSFRVKRKKARKMLAEIQDVVDSIQMEGLNHNGYIG